MFVIGFRNVVQTLIVETREYSRTHHTLLHLSPDELQGGEEPPPVDSMVCTVPLPVVVCCPMYRIRIACTGKIAPVRCKQCASQVSAITAAYAKRLGLKLSRWTAPISGLSWTTVAEVQGQVEFIVQLRLASDPGLGVANHYDRFTPVNINRYSNLVLADPSFRLKSPIDMSLGGDVYGSIVDGRKVSIDRRQCNSTLSTAFGSVRCSGGSLSARFPIAQIVIISRCRFL